MTELERGASGRTAGRTSAAAAIAAEVISWASAPGGARPRKTPGGEMGYPSLLTPPEPLRDAAAALASIHAAKLGLRAPPLGDGRPLGPGGVVLAAAVGLAETKGVAEALAEACPELSGAWDLVLRDAICARALATSIDADLADMLRARSPLTAALGRPAPGGEDETITTIAALARHADGKRLVVQTFARPGAPREVRRFRAAAMERLRTGETSLLDLVIEVYEAGLVFHRERVIEEISAARAVILGRGDPEAKIEDALAVAAFYGPLWRIRRAHAELLRTRHGLDLEGMLEGTRLFQLGARLAGEDA
ncbi:hypothetical protein [Polyangium mundeleinium]|uniref:FtsH ternary system domain-containing protein n=1 Tax=Polyangium mundeleinium TaxID=2995306 RepID=A0ABT5EZC0_9BACT|nr:hypothetical protein [Polyangium mundeleinium]MDC0746617.1 hypothetical protein [Polyangium mundeleinium]